MGLITQTQQDYYDGNNHGNYQFTSLDDVINQFMVAYVGEGKTISKVKRADVAFHAQRTLQELSFDTLKSIKAQEITVPATLQMILPQDYVNYTKVSWVDSSGIKHLIYPTSKTSNPSSNPVQNSDGEFKLQAVGEIVELTNYLTLNDQYDNLTIGMDIIGPYIPDGTIIGDIDNATGQTVIYMTDGTGTAVQPLETIANVSYSNIGTVSNTTFTFETNSGFLVSPRKNITVPNLSYTNIVPNSKKITGTNLDTYGLEVGMLINDNVDFASASYITDIAPDYIKISVEAQAIKSNISVTFTSAGFSDTDTWANYKSTTPSENQDDYIDDTYWPMDGSRYGLDPQHAQANGSFYIDEISGKIHFSSNISGKTVILDYISDSLGTDGEMQVHKFAEEAMYKCIAYAILSTRANVQEYIVRRFKKERFAAIRTAKLRLSNIKLEEITQILRGKSKQIKH